MAKITEAEISKRLSDILVECLGTPPESITPEAKIVADLGADSLDLAEIEIALEEEFELPNSDEDAEQFCDRNPEATVRDVIAFIKSKLEE